MALLTTWDTCAKTTSFVIITAELLYILCMKRERLTRCHVLELTTSTESRYCQLKPHLLYSAVARMIQQNFDLHIKNIHKLFR